MLRKLKEHVKFFTECSAIIAFSPPPIAESETTFFTRDIGGATGLKCLIKFFTLSRKARWEIGIFPLSLQKEKRRGNHEANSRQ